MNKLETRYAAYLSSQRTWGRIADFAFEPLRLRLGADWKTSYTPDFLVILPDGTIELHEVKPHKRGKGATAGAYWTEDARLKVKLAARLFPAQFVGVHEDPGEPAGWVREVFSD